MSAPESNPTADGIQGQFNLEEIEGMELMLRCEKTGTNVDLHLVAYKDPDSGDFSAGILGADYRHLVRSTTTLSVPIGILSLRSIRSLEARKKIPGGSVAVKNLQACLRNAAVSSWAEVAKSTQSRQSSLSLNDDSELGL
jgi:hypothetical protein